MKNLSAQKNTEYKYTIYEKIKKIQNIIHMIYEEEKII